MKLFRPALVTDYSLIDSAKLMASNILFEKWTPDQVAEWLRGLDDVILPYVHFFLNNEIDGKKLLLLTAYDLQKLTVTKLGHQELILEAVELLCTFRYGYETENLQSLGLQLGCKARSLHNQIQATTSENDRNRANVSPAGPHRRLSISILSAISDLLLSLKSLVAWFDKAPFESLYEMGLLRNTIVKVGLDLVTASQKEHTVNDVEGAIIKSCGYLADLCEEIVKSMSDPLVIQPASLHMATIRKTVGEELGMHIQSSYYGIHVIGGVKESSPAERCGKIEKGDEVIQVNYQTVVGWQLQKLVSHLKEKPKEVILLLKKRPHHVTLHGQVHNKKKNIDKNQASTLPKSLLKKRRSREGEAGLQDLVSTLPTQTMATELYSPRDENDTDGEVFRSGSESPQGYNLEIVTDGKPRRATVSGGSPTLSRPILDSVDLDSPLEHTRSLRHSDIVLTTAQLTERGRKERQELIKKGEEKESKVADNEEVPPTKVTEKVDSKGTRTSETGDKVDGATIDDIVNRRSVELRRREFRVIKPQMVDPTPEEKHRSKKISQEVAGNDIGNKPQLLGLKHIESIKMSDLPKTKAVGFIVDEPKEESKSFAYSVVGGVVHKTEVEQTVQSPVVRRKQKKTMVDRRISCRDLGKGDCNGWLYKRRGAASHALSRNWVKRWCVLKKANMFYYKHKADEKAEGCICLPAFQVSPCPELKTKKFAFKIHNLGRTFHFASDSLDDMSKWMNKTGLAAIHFDTSKDIATGGFSKPEVKILNEYYSESSDDEGDECNSDTIQPLDTTGASQLPNPADSADVVEMRKPKESMYSSEGDDLCNMLRNIENKGLAIDGVDKQKIRKSVIASRYLGPMEASSPGFDLMNKIKVQQSKQRTLLDKERELKEISTLLSNLSHESVQKYSQQHKLYSSDMKSDAIGQSDKPASNRKRGSSEDVDQKERKPGRQSSGTRM